MFRDKAVQLSHTAMEAYCFTHPPVVWIIGSICIGMFIGIVLIIGLLKLGGRI